MVFVESNQKMNTVESRTQNIDFAAIRSVITIHVPIK